MKLGHGAVSTLARDCRNWTDASTSCLRRLSRIRPGTPRPSAAVLAGRPRRDALRDVACGGDRRAPLATVVGVLHRLLCVELDRHDRVAAADRLGHGSAARLTVAKHVDALRAARVVCRGPRGHAEAIRGRALGGAQPLPGRHLIGECGARHLRLREGRRASLGRSVGSLFAAPIHAQVERQKLAARDPAACLRAGGGGARVTRRREQDRDQRETREQSDYGPREKRRHALIRHRPETKGDQATRCSGATRATRRIAGSTASAVHWRPS